MNYRLSIFILAIAGLMLLSCEDILERDISNEQLKLLLPADSSKVKTAEVAFQWEGVQGARFYRLQIAAPSFARPTSLFLDTVSSKKTVIIPLQPGSYEWRVQALNEGYETDFFVRHFVVDSASNLTGAELRLLSPADASYTNERETIFSWQPVELADKYLLEILSPTVKDTVVYASSVEMVLPQEGAVYQWRVRALNATGIVVSPVHTFTTDFEEPAAPELLFPSPDTTIATWPVTLKWRRQEADIQVDSMYLYQADQETLVPGFPKAIAKSSFNLSADLSLVPGNYFWSVASFDLAGNEGAKSTPRKFMVR